MRRVASALALLAIGGCGGEDDEGQSPAKIKLESPAFRDGGPLPTRFTCDGEGASPPFSWRDVPGEARDLVLVVEDRDVPVGAFTHWTVWKLPFEPDGRGRILEGNVAPEMDQGRNDLGSRGWIPACPPDGDGPHRYVFTLHALDEVLDLPDGAPPGAVRSAIAATGIADARLGATYHRR